MAQMVWEAKLQWAVFVVFKMGNDRDGLTLYRYCRHGTNSLEGGIHQNVIRKFGSFGVSPALADAVLPNYRLRHNIDVSINQNSNIKQDVMLIINNS